jgi:hypothetical protein
MSMLRATAVVYYVLTTRFCRRLQGFAQQILSVGRDDQAGAQLEDAYLRAAAELRQSLQKSGSSLLSAEETKLLALVGKAQSALGEQANEEAENTTSKQAEDALTKLLISASSQGAALLASQAEVAAAENEAGRMVESAQQRRSAAMSAAEESRQILGSATLALKRLGRAEWSEIKGTQTPTEAIVRMMGAVRLLLHDVNMDELTPGSAIPMNWSLCCKLMNHTRFVSRLLKVTMLFVSSV